MNIPKDYKRLKTLPEDPRYCSNFGKQTENALCMVSIFPVDRSEAMDCKDPEGLIKGIHGVLAENQALIEIGSGNKGDFLHYIYSIVKTHTENGVQYSLLMHNDHYTHVVAVRGFFTEYGMTGIRDATVYELYSREHPDFNSDEWLYDPYNPNLKDGYRMNIAEQEKYDELFPDHPLSQCRALVKHVIATL